jgi:hypothetical protein
LRHLFHLDAAVRTAYAVHLDYHRRSEFHARQLAHFPLGDFTGLLQLATASEANQLLMSPLAPNPKLEGLCPLVDPVLAIPAVS